MNLLTPQRRLAALREVCDGLVVSLSLPLDDPGGPGLWETCLLLTPPSTCGGQAAPR